MKKKFKNNNKRISKNPEIYLKFLVINSIMFSIEEEYTKYLELANIYRKSGYYDQSENILQKIKGKINLKENEMKNNNNSLFNEIKIKIELCYNKCLFEKGSINEAVENGKHLIDLLNNKESISYDKLNDNIKSKIYGNYAIYRFTQLISNTFKLKISRQKSETIKRTFFRHKTNYLQDHNF